MRGYTNDSGYQLRYACKPYEPFLCIEIFRLYIRVKREKAGYHLTLFGSRRIVEVYRPAGI